MKFTPDKRRRFQSTCERFVIPRQAVGVSERRLRNDQSQQGKLHRYAESLPSAALRRLFLKLSFSPRFRATTQHKRSRNAVFAQDKRRTGARYFVRSGTDENDIAI